MSYPYSREYREHVLLVFARMGLTKAEHDTFYGYSIDALLEDGWRPQLTQGRDEDPFFNPDGTRILVTTRIRYSLKWVDQAGNSLPTLYW